MKTTTIIIALMLAATVAGAQDTTSYLAFKTTPAPKSAWQKGYEAGLAACSCPSAGFRPSGGPTVVFMPQAQPQAAPAQQDWGWGDYMAEANAERRHQENLFQQRMEHTAEQGRLFYLSGGKVLE